LELPGLITDFFLKNKFFIIKQSLDSTKNENLAVGFGEEPSESTSIDAVCFDSNAHMPL
jgi:hypothetical protein